MIYALLLLIPSAYATFIIILLFALVVRKKKSAPEVHAITPGVSIVIPFRNEAAQLGNLLKTIGQQDYAGPIEVVLVNDQSEDDFRKVLQNHIMPDRFSLKILDSPFSPSHALTSKQQALDHGIRNTSHDLIALTDADMTLFPQWLNSLVAGTAHGASLVYGHTSINNIPAPIALLQQWQLEFLMATAYVFSCAGIPGSCMGNNLLISKKTYLDTGGQNTVGYSIVEDRDLLLLFRKKGYHASPVEPFRITAVTDPCPTHKQYIQQQLRWALGGFRRNSNLLVIALFFGIQNLLLLLSLTGMLPFPLTVLVLGGFLLTWLLYTVVFLQIRARCTAFSFPILYIWLIIETLILAPLLIIRPSIGWKERRLRT
jgi:cellulose synthase/poly-beta-1,6-N-acetylglucosamine synthase-like glycosyltransferase